MVKGIQFVSVFLVGILIGSLGHWYFSFKLPEVKAYKAAVEEQNKLNDMVHAGLVVEVNPKDMLLQVAKGGGKEKNNEDGEIIHVQFSDHTTIQEGMNFVKETGEELDLTRYLKSGQYVTVMIDGGDALALHYDNIDIIELDGVPAQE